MESVSIGVELLNRLRVGEAAAVSEFVALYKEQVCRQAKITLRHSVRSQGRDDDAFQTLVESMFNSALHRILSNIREGKLDCDLRPVAYMCRMIQHRWLNQKRKENRRKHEPVDNFDNIKAADPLPDDVVAERELIEKYQKLLGELTEWEQSLIQFRVGQQLPYAQISEIFLVSEHVLRARFADTVKKLRLLCG